MVEASYEFACEVLNPNEAWQLELLRELSERYVFVHQGRVIEAAGFEDLMTLPAAREYLGALLPAA